MVRILNVSSVVQFMKLHTSSVQGLGFNRHVERPYIQSKVCPTSKHDADEEEEKVWLKREGDVLECRTAPVSRETI